MLNLANRLRDIDDDIVPAGLRERSIQADGIADYFDLAEALLRPDSIAAALRVLSRQELAVLRLLADGSELPAELRPAAERCAARFLLDIDGVQFAAMAEVSAELDRAGIDSATALLTAETPMAVAAHSVDTSLIDRRAAERAARSCSAVAELLLTLSEEPARQLAKGGLALPDAKRIAAAAHIELDEVEPIHQLASLAGLVFCEHNDWLPSVEANAWLDADMAERWARLASALWQSQPHELRAAGQLFIAEPPRELPSLGRLAEILSWQFPVFPDAERILARYAASGERVGLVVGEELTAAGRVLAGNAQPEQFVVAVNGQLPENVTAIYVQPDFSIVVPGPATPQLDRMLRRFAAVEQADLASTFRISASSLNRALSTGLSISEIRDFLTEVSLTGLPQPVEFLLNDAEQRFGQVRVRSFDQPPLATAVRTLDPHLLEQLAVDHSLSTLGFMRQNGELVSRVGVTHTLLVLEAAKYPAALETEAGKIVALQPGVARARDAASAIDPVQAMWSRVRAARDTATDTTAWLGRQVQAAVKAKTTLTVEISLPGGGTAEYLLEPIGLAGNRLRARDRKADIERTLPLSSIVTLKPAPSQPN